MITKTKAFFFKLAAYPLTAFIAILCFCNYSYSQGKFEYSNDFMNIRKAMADSLNGGYYNKLLKRFQNNDSTLIPHEVLSLMIGFTANEEYRPFEDLQTEKAIYDLNERGYYEDAINESNLYLSTHPLSLRILKEKSYSLHQLNKRDSTDYFLDLTDKIMAAMKYSGSGKFEETPMFSLGLIDGEHYLLNNNLSIISKASGKNKEKFFLQMITAMKKNGDKVNMFFNIEHAVNPVKPSKPAREKKKKKHTRSESPESTETISEEKPVNN